MDFELENRFALVTAASEGLGYACAKTLVDEKCRVVISSRDIQKLNRACEETGAISGVSCDLGSLEALNHLASEIEKICDAPDILVISTAHPPTKPFSRATEEDWDIGHNLLIRPVITLCRRWLPIMMQKGYGRIIVIGSIAAVVFLPTTMVLLVGMVPTVVAALVDRTRERVKGMTVGAMNLAGCFPFIMDLWTSGHTPENAAQIAFQPLAISVMYAAAGLGYMIEWAMTGIVATFLTQKAIRRLHDIGVQQDGLAARWGREVTGEIALDPYGFPLEQERDEDS